MKPSSSRADPNSSSLLSSRVWLSFPKSRWSGGTSRPVPEVRGRGLQEVRERAVLVRPGRSERDRQVVDAAVDLVQLEGDGGAVVLQDGAVGHHVAAGVDGRQLHEPVADDRGAMIAAFASAGILVSASWDIVTTTSVPSGVTESTLPTGTPSTRTSLPS